MSGDIIFYDDVQQRAVNLLLSTFKEKDKFPKLIEALTKSFQELEDVFKELYTERSLDISIGEQLDNVGQIPAEDRNGNIDDVYRKNIIFKIFENQSYGGIETVIGAIKFLTESEHVINIEVFPANIQAYCDGLTSFDQVPENFVKRIDDLCLGGVKFMFIAMAFEQTPPFATENNFEIETKGFDWIDGEGNPLNDGGWFTWALQQ